MILRKKSIILLVCLVSMLTIIFSSVGTTYANLVNSVPTAETGLRLYVVDTEGKKVEIPDNSDTPVFSSSLVWEPGAMHAVTLTIEPPSGTTASFPLDYWLYPHVAKKETSVSMLSNKPNLADVLDAYIYKPGVYEGPGRPDLNSGEWIHLGSTSLSKLPNEVLIENPLGKLSTASPVSHTLIIKMRESAGNEYNENGTQTSVHITLAVKDPAANSSSSNGNNS